MDFIGTAGNDTLTGTSAADFFDIRQGGQDKVSGGTGDDVMFAGGTLDALDVVNGGNGYDRLDLSGDYSAGLTLGASTLRNVEDITFYGGFSYKIIANTLTVNPGAVLQVDGHGMTAGQSLYFDGSAETDGSFLILDGASDDTYFGGALSDSIGIGFGGTDKVFAGGGDDTIGAEWAFTAADTVDGGAGYDTLVLSGDYSGGLAITSSMLANVESLALLDDHVYALSVQDAVVGAGKNLYVGGEGINGTGHMNFDGSAETDGTFSFRDSIGNDILTGGANGDVFEGRNGGSDLFVGNGGDDSIGMFGNLDPTDVIFGGAGHDWVALDGDYSAGIVFGAFTINSIELLSVVAGHNYKITTNDANVGPGAQLVVDASALTAANHIDFDGSAETDGSFWFADGAGNDTFKGGAGNDYLGTNLGGGDDKFFGGGGDDIVSFFGTSYSAGDVIDGGAGNDSVAIAGDFSGGLVLNSSRMQNVEALSLGAGFSYSITAANSLVGPGAQLEVSAGLTAVNHIDFDGSAETDGSFQFYGGAGNDTFKGGAGNDYFDAGAGSDKLFGGGGDDVMSFFGTSYTASDFIDGGTGNDSVAIAGDFSGGLSLNSSRMQNVEALSLGAGFSYSIVAANSLVAAGATMDINAFYLAAGDHLVFNGAAELDGHFRLTGGNGDDQLTGGAQADQFRMIRAGHDVMNGGGGADTFDISSGFTAADQVNGGAGIDTVFLSQNLGAGITFAAQTMTGIEAINLDAGGGHGYTLTTNDGNVAANGLLTIDGSTLTAGEALKVDGSAEMDGRFSMTGGHGADVLRGGAGNDQLQGADGIDQLYGNAGIDVLTGGLGGDTLYGGAGNDVFAYGDIGETTVAAFDKIADWNAGDRIKLAAIDANTGVAGDQAFAFIGSAAFSAAGQLQVTATASATYIRGDVDGDGGADFMIRLSGNQTLAASAFIL